MKKLITLLILFVGMVSTVSADTYTVYFRPYSENINEGGNWLSDGATIWLRMKKSDNTSQDVQMTTVSGYAGVYSASYNTEYNSWIQFVRKSSDGNTTHNYSSTITSCPSSDMYYAQGKAWDSWSPTDTRPLGSWVMFGNRHITAHNDNWDGTSTYNAMTLKAGTTHTYELTVSSKAVKNGTYGYKFMGNGSYVVGDVTQDGWPNLNLTIGDGDGYYDIVYTLDELTLAASAVATKKSGATLTYKYFVYDYDPDYSPAGISNITGQRWWDNEMTDKNTAGTYEYSVNSKNLTKDTKYGFKVMEQVWDGSSAIEGYNCLLNTNDLSTDLGYKTTTIDKNRAYDVTFSVTPSANNYEMSASDFEITADAITEGYYIINSYGSWHVGDLMTQKGEVYSATLTGLKGCYFLILPASALSASESDTWTWTSVIRPTANKQNIGFVNDSGKTTTEYNNSWMIAPENDANVTITFAPGSSNWVISQSFTRNISAGYATFSSAYDVAIPDGVTAYYCTGIDGSKELEMDTFSDGIPANQGALLQGSGEVTFTPAASTPSAPVTNWLKPGTGTLVPQTDGDGNTNFILTNNTVNGSADLKFYKVNSAGNTVAAGKAYLQIPNNIEARDFFWFGDETTGIEAAKASQKMNGEFFNLAGQRVAQPTKGLYIVNGKKVIMK